MTAYLATYVMQDHDFVLTTDGTQTLQALVGQQAYLQVTQTNGQIATIDLSQYMLRQDNLNLTLSLSALASSLTDLQIDAYRSTAVPMLDPTIDGFSARIAVCDANIAGDVTIAWTSLASPEVRNDIYQRAAMNDLVLSSSNCRDFSNSLVSVNGVFHKTYFYNHELYVQDGYGNIKNTQKDRIALYDTTAVGGHEIVSIGVMNIDASNTKPFNGVTLSFPCADFTGKTVLLVLGGYLHVLDGTYRVINRNRIIIDTCKIDLINQFVHNPNTFYTKSGMATAVFEDRLRTAPQSALTVHDEIMCYLWNYYPKALANTTAPVNMIAFNPPPNPTIPSVAEQITYYLQNQAPWEQATSVAPALFSAYEYTARALINAPTVADSIYKFLATYPTITVPQPAMLVDYEWTPKYETIRGIVGTIPTDRFKCDAFVYDTLLSPHSFFVVINTPQLYQRNYALTQMQIPAQYVHHGKDTPRGILLYNQQAALPYLLYSESERQWHNFSFDYAKTCQDVYKTVINPQAIASPLYDLKSDCLGYTAELLELYAPH